jgi:ethylmalonyl-CoA/methylmalonyl-CoA decarboxylase
VRKYLNTKEMNCACRLATALRWSGSSPFSWLGSYHRGFSSSLLDSRHRYILDLLRKDAGAGSVVFHGPNTEGVGRLVFSNPPAKNAVSASMMIDLAEILPHLERAAALDMKVLLVEGDTNSTAFCSGMDFAIVNTLLLSRDALHMSLFMTEALNTILGLSCISVCVVHGPAVGGGAELTTCCDFRIMSTSAYIHFVQGVMGLTTGWGGGHRLVQLVGRRNAMMLTGTSRKMDAVAAMEMGLVDNVTPESSGSMHTDVGMFIKPFIYKSKAVLRDIKQVCMLPLVPGLQSTSEEQNIFANRWKGEEHIKALTAFESHRK